jgi:hypothetical protein
MIARKGARPYARRDPASSAYFLSGIQYSHQ